jgi:hypothetical protein
LKKRNVNQDDEQRKIIYHCLFLLMYKKSLFPSDRFLFFLNNIYVFVCLSFPFLSLSSSTTKRIRDFFFQSCIFVVCFLFFFFFSSSLFYSYYYYYRYARVCVCLGRCIRVSMRVCYILFFLCVYEDDSI